MTRDTSVPTGGAGAATGLLERLERECSAAVTACATAAEASARAVREEAERAAQARRRHALSARARQHAQEARGARDAAQQRVVAETLAARADAIDRVLATAAAQAESLASRADLTDCLRNDITQALRYLPDDAITVRCAASVAPLARAAMACVDAARAEDRSEHQAEERVQLIVDPTVPFGIVATSSDGRVSVDATFGRRIASDRRRLAIRIAQLLDESFG